IPSGPGIGADPGNGLAPPTGIGPPPPVVPATGIGTPGLRPGLPEGGPPPGPPVPVPGDPRMDLQRPAPGALDRGFSVTQLPPDALRKPQNDLSRQLQPPVDPGMPPVGSPPSGSVPAIS